MPKRNPPAPRNRNLLDEARCIFVEGPIGVGKTTLAKRLANHLEARLLLETPEANPFLSRFYQDRQRFALPTQLAFLFQRVDRLRENVLPERIGQAVVADYLLDKDRLFARLTLPDDEYALYNRVYETLAPQAPSPDLVIYLQAKPETLIARVRRRARAAERSIDDLYLTRLAEGYSRFFYDYTAAPVMVVDSENLNFVDRDADFQLLLDRIRTMRGPREYFNFGD